MTSNKDGRPLTLASRRGKDLVPHVYDADWEVIRCKLNGNFGRAILLCLLIPAQSLYMFRSLTSTRQSEFSVLNKWATLLNNQVNHSTHLPCVLYCTVYDAFPIFYSL